MCILSWKRRPCLGVISIHQRGTMEDEKQTGERNTERVRRKRMITADFPLSRSETRWCSLSALWTTQTAVSAPQCCMITSKCLASPWTNHHTSLWLQTSTACSVGHMVTTCFLASWSQVERHRSCKPFSATKGLIATLNSYFEELIFLLLLFFLFPHPASGSKGENPTFKRP